MAEHGSELLVLVADEQSLADVQQRYTVAQVASPRLVVVAAKPDEAAALRAHQGVRAVTDGPLADDVVADLDEGERLFAAAWSQRQAEDTKHRPGEGLPWDAPGWLPPDPPPGAAGND